ncbi:MAG: rhodanese-like domain-containing protein, partial [Patescibacteria group bacterium]|nr:rhodanese-like domain-containing protein [Patescibacteria group bacterium]
WYISYIKERKPEWFGSTKKSTWKDHTTPIPERSIPINAIQEWINREQPLIVDVRQPISYKLGHIPNSLNIPLEYLENMLSVTNPFCLNKTILFVCPIGEKSLLLASYFAKEKRVPAYSLEGGITNWKDHGFPLERDL